MFQLLSERKTNTEKSTPQAAIAPPTEWPAPKTGRAHLVLVMGPPGVGKSTLVESLSRVCPRQNAHIDSDHVACTRPGGIEKDRLDLIERNLYHCLLNFKEWGAEYLFCSWITEHQHRLDRLMTRLRAAHIVTRGITLHAPINVLVDRMHSRNGARFEADGQNLDYLRTLCTRLDRLTACAHFDTADRSRADVLNRVRALVSAAEYWEN